jgi:hypothetical protein
MRKYFIKSTILISLMTAALSFSATIMDRIQVAYSRVLFPVDRNGFEIPQAIIGGNVAYSGMGPVYVTLSIGGQKYTQPTDIDGNFSFLAYTNFAGSYELNAWLPPSTEQGTRTEIRYAGKISRENK